MSKPKVDFHWNYSKSVIIERKGFGKELNKFFADRLAKYSIPYVPYHTGRLNDSVYTRGTKNKGYITYTAPYSGYQYTGNNGSGKPSSEWNRDRSVHSLATSQWVDVAWAHYGAIISREVNRKRKELAHD